MNLYIRNRHVAFPITKFFVILVTTPYLILAQLEESNNDNWHNSSKNYGCNTNEAKTVKSTSIINCDITSRIINTYEISGLSEPIYTITGNAQYSNGKQGQALKIDKNYTESVILLDALNVDPREFSVSFWVNPQSGDAGLGHILSNTCVACATPSGWFFLSSPAEDRTQRTLQFGIYDNVGNLSKTEIPIPVDSFTNIVGIFDGSSIRIFADGELAAQTPFAGIFDNSNIVKVSSGLSYPIPLKAGMGAYCNFCYLWTGLIDDLRIYNKSLGISEVQEIFSLKNVTSVPENLLIGHWNFENSLNDSSQSKNPSGYVNTLMGSMVFSPDDRLFFTEKNTGKIRIMENDIVLDEPFFTVSDYFVHFEQGLLGLALDPLFAKNHFVYLYYTYKDEGTGNPFNRVIRLTDNGNNTADPSYSVILDRIPATFGYHSGGALAFGPDDKLYIAVGDATMSEQPQNTSSWLGKVLRINRDGTIPLNNPFPNSLVFNTGHRNMYGIAFDKAGFGIVTENGQSLYDEINTLEKASNYGYPTTQPADTAPESSNSTSDVKPLRSYKFIIAPTQAIFYADKKIPELQDQFLFGSVVPGIHSLNIAKHNNTIYEKEIRLSTFPYEAVIGISSDKAGNIYFGGHKIHKLQSLVQDSERQIVFPIQINSTYNINRLDIYSLDGSADDNGPDKFMLVNMSTVSDNTTTDNPEDYVDISIPKDIMEDIESIMIIPNSNTVSDLSNPEIINIENVFDKGKEIGFTVEDLSSSRVIHIILESSQSFNESNMILLVNSNKNNNLDEGEEMGMRVR
jgi:Glucose / Sorbosone dehydrogenase/Concanavalin A-like lectin/glucanases superfamily